MLIVIQDATSPADTAEGFVDAGLEEDIATLPLGQPTSGGLLQGWDLSSLRTGQGEITRTLRF